MLISAGSKTCGGTRRLLQKKLEKNDPDPKTAAFRMAVFLEAFERYQIRGIVDVRDPDDWVPLNDDGAYMRKTHLNSDGDRNYD
jgi:hypothetical protein